MSDITTPMMNVLERALNVTAKRHELVVTNMANIDTPGYRTKDLDFRSELQRAGRPTKQPVWRPYETSPVWCKGLTATT